MLLTRALSGLAVVMVFAATPALGAPLGLAPGDLIEQLEWSSNGGGSYTSDSASANVVGDIQSVTIDPAITNLLSGVTFSLDLDLDSQSVIPNGGSNVIAIANFVGSSTISPDFTISDDTGTILTGNLTSMLSLVGFLDLNNLVNPSFVGAANIVVTGGDTNLVNALGGMGGTGELTISGGIFGFSPDLGTLLADLNAFNSNFTFSGSGLIVPDSSAPFVPEPSTALLLGFGLVGLVGASRRLRKPRS